MYVAIVIAAELMTVIVCGCMFTYFSRSQGREDGTKSIIVGLSVSLPILAITLSVMAWAYLHVIIH